MTSIPQTKETTVQRDRYENRFRMPAGTQYIRIQGRELPIASLSGTRSGGRFYLASDPTVGYFICTRQATVKEIHRDVKPTVDVRPEPKANPTFDPSDWR